MAPKRKARKDTEYYKPTIAVKLTTGGYSSKPEDVHARNMKQAKIEKAAIERRKELTAKRKNKYRQSEKGKETTKKYRKGRLARFKARLNVLEAKEKFVEG